MILVSPPTLFETPLEVSLSKFKIPANTEGKDRRRPPRSGGREPIDQDTGFVSTEPDTMPSVPSQATAAATQRDPAAQLPIMVNWPKTGTAHDRPNMTASMHKTDTNSRRTGKDTSRLPVGNSDERSRGERLAGKVSRRRRPQGVQGFARSWFSFGGSTSHSAARKRAAVDSQSGSSRHHTTRRSKRYVPDPTEETEEKVGVSSGSFPHGTTKLEVSLATRANAQVSNKRPVGSGKKIISDDTEGERGLDPDTCAGSTEDKLVARLNNPDDSDYKHHGRSRRGDGPGQNDVVVDTHRSRRTHGSRNEPVRRSGQEKSRPPTRTATNTSLGGLIRSLFSRNAAIETPKRSNLSRHR